MKIPLKKALNILITNFFIKHSIIDLHSGFDKTLVISSLKLNYVRTCAKFNFLSKNSFFFNLKYPVYIALTAIDTEAPFSEINKTSLVLFQFYKYVAFGFKNKYFFNLFSLKLHITRFSVYLNNFSLGVLKKK